MAWPQQDPTNGANNPNTSQDTTNVNGKVIVERLLLSSLTYARTQALSPCFVSTSFTCKAMALLDVYNLKKSNGHMIKLPLIIQEMHNENKSIYTSP
jgi:hypothetical protein